MLASALKYLRKTNTMHFKLTAAFKLKSDSQKILGWQPTDFLDKKGIFRNKQ
jgi:hypothetical protein